MKIQRSSDPVLFLSKLEKKSITDAIDDAERKTSGEIRVHLERKFKGSLMDHAAHEFERLGMANTEQRNGVLIFLCVKSHQFAILGDQGINEKVPTDFWNEIVAGMIPHFKEDQFAEGICFAIQKTGEKLAEFFPYQRDDINELPDEISYSL